MSMTQVAFLKKAGIPKKAEIEERIQSMGYDFSILDEDEEFYNTGGLNCKINGHETFFELYFGETDEILAECEWIKPHITDQDTVLSFVWGADFAAGACIGLISIALIDSSDAQVFYLDDEMKYTRDTLVADIPEFLAGLEKQKGR